MRVAVGRVDPVLSWVLHQPRRVTQCAPVVVDLDPGDERKEQEDDAGGQLPARQQVLRLLPELQVNEKEGHFYPWSICRWR